MQRTLTCGFGLWIASLGLTIGTAGAQQATPDTAPAAEAASTAAASPQGASLTLSGDVVLTLRASAGGMTPQQRVDAIDGRVSDLLGIPHIKPSDVAVYTPPGRAPVIYALGRRLITVDAATAKSEGEGRKPLELAEIWAKKLQQVLPRVNYRPSNEPEPVIPAHPPLTVTDDLSKVGGNVGYISLRNKVVFKISGPQSNGMTAQERALVLTKRLQVAANRLSSASATDITVAPVAAGKGNPQEQITVGTTPIITVDEPQAKAAGYKSAEQLATVWAKNVRTVLGLSDTTAPATAAAPTNSAPAPVNPGASAAPAPPTAPLAPTVPAQPAPTTGGA